MDVGAPSNFVRILEIFDNKFIDLKEKFEAVSISDEVTATTMRDVYSQCNYILDPHGAVGYRALADHLEEALPYLKNKGAHRELATAYFHLADVYFSLKRKKMALQLRGPAEVEEEQNLS